MFTNNHEPWKRLSVTFLIPPWRNNVRSIKELCNTAVPTILLWYFVPPFDFYLRQLCQISTIFTSDVKRGSVADEQWKEEQCSTITVQNSNKNIVKWSKNQSVITVVNISNEFTAVKTLYCGRGVTLTPHSLLVPRSWKGRAIPLLPIWAVRPVRSLSACTRVHFT
jgi:hypothetical protein